MITASSGPWSTKRSSTEAIQGIMYTKLSAVLVVGCLLVGCGQEAVSVRQTGVGTGSVEIRGEVWADNWFAFYLGETLVAEDTVPITTERSFNAEVFEFKADYPLVLNFVVKDFKQDDSGLEYIGTRRQQIGDGGFIAQFTDVSTGQTIAVTDENWKCYVLHEGPLDPACAEVRSPQPGIAPCDFLRREEPAGWKSAGFDDGSWTLVSSYSEREVRPKEGYDQIRWDGSARLIWSSDLKLHNTVLVRLVIEEPR